MCPIPAFEFAKGKLKTNRNLHTKHEENEISKEHKSSRG